MRVAMLLLLCLPDPAWAQDKGMGATLRRVTRRAKARLHRLTPPAVRRRLAVRREVSRLLGGSPHLARFPLVRRKGLRPKLSCGAADHLAHVAHRAEVVSFAAGKAIPDPALQVGFLALEGMVAAALHRGETRLMELTLLEAQRHYHRLGPETPLSGRALRWLRGRLLRRLETLRAAEHDAARYRTWQVLRDVEQHLGARGIPL